MDILNSFLYRMLNQYIDLNNIIKLCQTTGTIEIKDDSIVGKYFYKDTVRHINMYFKKDILNCEIYYEYNKEVMFAKETDDGYLSRYIKTSILENYEKVYLEKNILKQLSYDNQKIFKESIENTAFISRIKGVDKTKYTIDEIIYTNIDDKILRKHEIISNDSEATDCIFYSISENFKDGVFLSNDVSLAESYMIFSEIDEKTYREYLSKKIEKTLKKI